MTQNRNKPKQTLYFEDWLGRKNTRCYAVETTNTAIFRNVDNHRLEVEQPKWQNSLHWDCSEIVIFGPVLSCLKIILFLFTALPVCPLVFGQELGVTKAVHQDLL